MLQCNIEHPSLLVNHPAKPAKSVRFASLPRHIVALAGGRRGWRAVTCDRSMAAMRRGPRLPATLGIDRVGACGAKGRHGACRPSIGNRLEQHRWHGRSAKLLIGIIARRFRKIAGHFAVALAIRAVAVSAAVGVQRQTTMGIRQIRRLQRLLGIHRKQASRKK